MNTTSAVQIANLQKLSATALKTKYRELFREESRSSNRQYLFRRVAWRMQELAEGGISERARQRAREVANDADLRIHPPKSFILPTRETVRDSRDYRLPPVGAMLSRTFKGKSIEVRVLDEGFDYQGRRYRSLSAIASAATGTRWNGFLFFGLTDGSGKKKWIAH